MPLSLPPLHFVHGNSFPSGTYGALFRSLEQHYSVHALDMHCHDPRFPVTDGWAELGQELIESLIALHAGPVILVGHSMGGMLSLMAARQRPDLVRCVVLLDAPVVAGARALLLRLAKLIGIDSRFSPARFSVKRRNVWPDAAAAYQHYAGKSKFAIWPPEVLRDYLQHGLVAHPDGVSLRFDRDIETAVYRSLPSNMGQVIRPPFPLPVGFVGGEDSVECRMAGSRATRALVGAHYTLLPGGHLLPMEAPEATAQALHRTIQSLLG